MGARRHRIGLNGAGVAQKAERWISALLVLVLPAAFLPQWAVAAPPPSPRQEPDFIVERWSGSIDVAFASDWTALGPTSAGMQRERYFADMDLQVDQSGKVTGVITETLDSYTYSPDPGKCFAGEPWIDCWLIYTIVQPQATISVEGKRSLDVNNKPVLDITSWKSITGWKVQFRQSATDPWTGKVYAGGGDIEYPYDIGGIAGRWSIETYNDGRSPQARWAGTSHMPGRGYFAEDGHLIGYADEPYLALDPELVERSVFLDRVRVDDRYDSKVTWNAVGGGEVKWQMADTPTETSPTTDAPVVPRTYDVGGPGPGTRALTVQATNTLQKSSAPVTTNVTVAPVPVSAEGGASHIKATKVGPVVSYNYQIKFPQPALEGMIQKVPEYIPFIGGYPMGVKKTQVSGKVETKSTGEGSFAGGVQSEFTAMGQTGGFEIKARGVSKNLPDHVESEGDADFKLYGKMKDEEPLLKLFPQLNAPLAALGRFCQPCYSVIANRAKIRAELSPSAQATVGVKDKGDGYKFVQAQFIGMLEMTLTLVMDIVKGYLEMTAYSKTQGWATFQVPTAPLLKELAFKIIIGAQINVAGFAIIPAEGGWQWSTAGSPAADGPHLAQGTLTPAPTSPAGLYDTGATLVPLAGGGSDQRLVQGVFPGAHPSLATTTSRQLAVWVQDKGGTAPGGQELMYAWAGSNGQWQAAKAITNDTTGDFMPHALFVNDTTGLAVWQRLDTATPGDFGADPESYLKHVQVVAATWNAGTNQWSAIKQISTAGALNGRPQGAALADGALAVWVNNSAGHIMGDPAHLDSIQFSRYKTSGATWSAPAPVVANFAGLLDFTLASAGTQAALVYSRDLDGDFTDMSDLELFVTRWSGSAWSTPERLTTNTMIDDAPQLALDANANPLLVWRQDRQLRFLSGAWNAAPVNLDLAHGDLTSDAGQGVDGALVRGTNGDLAFVWQEVHNAQTRLGYALFDSASKTWSTARSYAPPPAALPASAVASQITYPSMSLVPVAGDPTSRDRLLVAYQLAPATPVTRTVDGITIPDIPLVGTPDLRLADVLLGTNLALQPALSVSPADAQPGSNISLSAVVLNNGAFAAGGVPLVLKSWQTGVDGDVPVVLATQTLPPIDAGAATTVTLSFAAPAKGDRTLLLCIDGDNTKQGCVAQHTLHETDETDNSALLRGQLTVQTLASDILPDGILVRALASHPGPLYAGDHVTATLHLDSLTGPVVGAVDGTFPITPTAQIPLAAVVVAGFLTPSRHIVFWQFAGQGDGPAPVSDASRLPDLRASATQVGFGRSAGASAPFVIELENAGVVPSHGGRLAVLDGLPGQSSTHVLLSLPLPDIAAGRSATLTGTLQLAGTPAASHGLSAVYVSIDPDAAVDEWNEANNLLMAGNLTRMTTAHATYLPILVR